MARVESFTRAAAEEGIAQPSLSQQILKLETELGAPLFQRLGRSVRLTEYGELLLPQAHAILRGFADARHSIQALLTGRRDRLVVGSIPTVMPYIVANRLRSFLNQHSDVDLQLVEDTTAHLVEGLQAGDIDLAILSLPLSGPNLLCTELFREEILLAVPPEHRLARLETIDLRELRHEPLLLLKEGHCFRDNALAACRKARVTPNSIFESDQFESIFALVAAGTGVSMAPAMAASAAAGCRLIPLHPKGYRRIGYVHLRRQFREAAGKAFIDWLTRGRLVPTVDLPD